MLAANSISHHRRPLVDYENPRAASDALRDTHRVAMQELSRKSTRKTWHTFLMLIATASSGLIINDNMGASS
jgi:hypothetical protein